MGCWWDGVVGKTSYRVTFNRNLTEGKKRAFQLEETISAKALRPEHI